MCLEKMSANQLQNWIAKLSMAVCDNDNSVLYQKWLSEAQAEQLKRINGSLVVSCVKKK